MLILNLPVVYGLAIYNVYEQIFIHLKGTAREKRKMKVCISAPTSGWVRYLQDTPVGLTTEWQSYAYEFEMTKKTDHNGRLEFNLGRRSSLADVNIKNVRLVQVEEFSDDAVFVK